MHSYRSASDGLAYAPEALPELIDLPATGPRFQSNLNPSATDLSRLSGDAVVERQWQNKDEPQHARVFSLHASAVSNDSSSQPDIGRQHGLTHHQSQQSFDPGDQVRHSTSCMADIVVTCHRLVSTMLHCMLWSMLLLVS